MVAGPLFVKPSVRVPEAPGSARKAGGSGVERAAQPSFWMSSRTPSTWTLARSSESKTPAM